MFLIFMVKGICYLAFSGIMYIHYFMLSKGVEIMSAARIMEDIIISEEDKNVIGACVTDDYLKISSMLGMTPLQKICFLLGLRLLLT